MMGCSHLCMKELIAQNSIPQTQAQTLLDIADMPHLGSNTGCCNPSALETREPGLELLPELTNHD